MSNLEIRDVVPGDISSITAIYREAVLHGTASFELDPPDTTEMLERMQSIVGSGFPYIVALNASGALLGYAYANLYRSRPAYRWTCENSVYIDSSAQSMGLGKKLMEVIVDRCAQLGFRQMVSVIGGADHIASIKLHERLGFKKVGQLPATGFKHGVWLDSILMQKALGGGSDIVPDENSYPGTLYKPQN
ncbi:Phosphinothricin N-acetyltransferase [Nymphon striatum]|nr:Phosphinothricin N-acetyltransferase [Nymphon striatum]